MPDSNEGFDEDILNLKKLIITNAKAKADMKKKTIE